MKTAIKILAIAGIVAALIAWLRASTPMSPIAFIRVVDAAGNPVAGATIQPDGLRPKNNGGHYLWTDRFSVKPLPVTTDSAGVARVPYPHFVEERLETGEISFGVDHPDYCSDRPFRIVAAAPPANARLRTKVEYYLKYGLALLTRKASVHPDPVVLQRGAIVEVSGYIGSKESRVPTVIPMTSANMWPGQEFWKRTAAGALVTRKIPAGTNHLRLVQIKDGAPNYFSDFVTFDAKVGETNRIDLELKPGARVSGRVADAVPRPVMNGRVVAEIVQEGIDPQSTPPRWHVWSEIAPDGTYVFESIPAGRMEMVAVCDGFVSENGAAIARTSQRTPQWFTIKQAAENVVLRMEPAAFVEVTVLDDDGRPLEGAEVWFWPNVLWNNHGSTIFADGVYNTADILKSGRKPGWASGGGKVNRFSAASDHRGIALVCDLPEMPGAQSFMVSHRSFEMPVHRDPGGDVSRNSQVTLRAGETNRVTVKLQKKGKEFVTH